MKVSRSSRWILAAIVTVAVFGSGRLLAAPQQTPPPSQSEFKPMTDTTAQETLPATPFVFGAYAVAWLVVLGYLWTISRRASRLEREIADLRRRMPGSSAGRG